MLDLITVSVTVEDLACGWERFISPAPTEPDRRACEYCPVEHALTRAVGENVLTNGKEVWLARLDADRLAKPGMVRHVVLPDDVQKTTKQIDKGLLVEPFTFEIERPQ